MFNRELFKLFLSNQMLMFTKVELLNKFKLKSENYFKIHIINTNIIRCNPKYSSILTFFDAPILYIWKHINIPIPTSPLPIENNSMYEHNVLSKGINCMVCFLIILSILGIYHSFVLAIFIFHYSNYQFFIF